MSNLAVTWTNSSFCADNTCVQVAIVDGSVLVRDGKDVDRPHLQFSRSEWDEFCAALTADEIKLV